MASSKNYLNFILDQLTSLGEISHRQMMGEYMLYYRGRLFAYICDDRLLIKPVPAALKMMPGAPMEPPYEGAKPMLLAEDVDNRSFLCDLVEKMYEELPEPKRRK
ncbi:MAG: TfoX/Sxy family protein [Clostridia bacterium]|nr:TfoX/Sxy family protein [Clostridia bacterium]